MRTLPLSADICPQVGFQIPRGPLPHPLRPGPLPLACLSSYCICRLMLINPGVRKVEGLCLPWGWEGRLSFLLFSTPCPIQAGPGGGGCTRAHRGALCRRHRAAGGESAGRRRLPVLPALRGANPKLRGRRPRPSAGPSALGVEGSGRAPPAAAQHFATAAHSAAGRALETRAPRVAVVWERGREGQAAAGQRPPAASASSVWRATAREPRSLAEGQRPGARRRGRTTRRRSGVRRGSASAFLLSPALPARSFVPGVPVAPPQLAGHGSAASAVSPRGQAALRREPRTLEVGQGGRDSAVASGAGGRVEGAKLSYSYFAPSPSYLWAKWNSGLPGVHPHPSISLAHSCFLAPWFYGRTRGGLLREGKRRENNGASWGVGFRCGVPQRRGRRGPGPDGASCACS